jgi:hypothetical protein
MGRGGRGSRCRRAPITLINRSRSWSSWSRSWRRRRRSRSWRRRGRWRWRGGAEIIDKGRRGRRWTKVLIT